MYSSSDQMALSKSCPKLRRLKLIVDYFYIDLFRSRYRPEEKAIRELPIVAAFCSVRGIDVFSLQNMAEDRAVGNPNTRVPSDKHRDQIQRLGGILRQMVTRPREERVRV